MKFEDIEVFTCSSSLRSCLSLSLVFSWEIFSFIITVILCKLVAISFRPAELASFFLYVFISTMLLFIPRKLQD